MSQDYVLPDRAEIEVFEDPTTRPDRRTKMVAKCKLGPCVLDTSRITLAETPAPLVLARIRPGPLFISPEAMKDLLTWDEGHGQEESSEEAAPGTAPHDAGGCVSGAG